MELQFENFEFQSNKNPNKSIPNNYLAPQDRRYAMKINCVDLKYSIKVWDRFAGRLVYNQIGVNKNLYEHVRKVLNYYTKKETHPTNFKMDTKNLLIIFK
jgi:hypothetical protein